MNDTVGRPLTIHCEGPSVIAREVHVRSAPATERIDIWIATLAELRSNAAQYRTWLDPSEVDRMQRFRFDEDRERFLLGHGYLRWIMGQYLGYPPHAIPFERGAYGKPFISGSDLRFNLSDTKDAVAVACSPTLDLGVDIETISRRVDHEAVSQHYFTPEEIDDMAAAKEPKRRFLEFWTRKEAVLKASGVGIMDDLRVLRVDGKTNELIIRHQAFKDMAASAYHVHTWHWGSDHIISLALPAVHPPVRFLHFA